MDPQKDTKSELITLDIGGMTCASCVGRVEKALGKISGVEAASVNLATEQAKIRLKANSGLKTDEIIALVEKTGYQAKISKPHGIPELARSQTFWGTDGLGRVLMGFALSAPLFLPMLLMPFGIHWALSPEWQLLLASPVQFFLGWRFYKAGFKSLMSGVGNMDLLVALGTSAAYGLSVYQMLSANHATHELYFEGSAVIICMVLLGKWLEARAKQQTSEAIRALQKLWPEHAKVIDQDIVIAPGVSLDQFRDLPLDQVFPNDRILVLPGERIPVDGLILLGNSHVDESLLTGESDPVKKHIGAKVIGGSLNGEGLLVIEAQAVGVESVLSKIIALVEDAQTQKAPIQKLVDQVSAIFVPSVIVIAIITGLANWIYLDSASIAILRAVSVLVIACPCALGLATPAAIMAGTGVAARFGILIKDPQVLELAHRLNIVAFDKTGTLTIGKPRLIQIIPFQNADTEESVLATAAGLQLGSEHPLAKALLDAAKDKCFSPITPVDSKAVPGIGITGKPSSGPWAGQDLSLQSVASLESSPYYPAILERAKACFDAGQTVSILMNNAAPLQPLAVIAFGDELKEHAQEAIASLHQLHIRAVMLSGDNVAAANRVGKSININEVFAQVLPGDKADIIRKLQSKDGQRKFVAMVGDGINDAPALAISDIGFAMGATGTGTAIETADVALMDDDLRKLPRFVRLSRNTHSILVQNIVLALGIKSIFLTLTVLGMGTMWMAVFADAGASLLVVGNGLRLLRVNN